MSSILALVLVPALAIPDRDLRATRPTAPTRVDLTQISRLEIDPPAIVLRDRRCRQRLLVTGYVNQRPVDLTDAAALTVANEQIARLTDEKELVPAGDGATEVVARFGKLVAKAPVKAAQFRQTRPINFGNEIVPIFTKLGCNSGGCHGKLAGQNGFRLSLLGFDAGADFDALVKEGRGRRLFPASPAQSLVLRKGAGLAPHGGGKLLKAGDESYQLLVEWIQQGMPFGSTADPVVAAISVTPSERVLDRRAAQRLRVTARYSDGASEDVTRYVQFQSNNESVATVDAAARVAVGDFSGEAAIMARYQGQIAIFRATVPVSSRTETAPALAASNFIDRLTARKWQALGLVPSGPIDDAHFIRRLSIDLRGKLPEPEEVCRFVAAKDSHKREQLIDDYLASNDYAAYQAMRWGAILQNQRGNRPENAAGTHAFSLWLKQGFASDLPYDQFARAILTATGLPEINPPVAWFRRIRTMEELVDNTAEVFLGTRIQCARCHHHPFEKWSQDDYYSLAAFFARVGRKPYVKTDRRRGVEAIYVVRQGESRQPRTGKVMPPRGLGGAEIIVPSGDDPREKLVDWLVQPNNPFFARALVNRIWGQLLGQGIVEPVDDLRMTNPPSNAELLDALAADFVKSGYSIKHVVRQICGSATYQLSSEPNATNKDDRQQFSRYYARRLPAEALLDALDQVTGVRSEFGLPAEMRAIDLPDEAVESYFLDIFGRPRRASSCECERTSDANLSQSLHLLNSAEVQTKLNSPSGRATRLAADPRTDAEKVNELYLVFFARLPNADERSTVLGYLGGARDKKSAYQNLLWALINAKEFQFNL